MATGKTTGQGTDLLWGLDHNYDSHSFYLQFGKDINRRRLEIVGLDMRDIELLNQNPRKGLDRLKLGQVEWLPMMKENRSMVSLVVWEDYWMMAG